MKIINGQWQVGDLLASKRYMVYDFGVVLIIRKTRATDLVCVYNFYSFAEKNIFKDYFLPSPDWRRLK